MHPDEIGNHYEMRFICHLDQTRLLGVGASVSTGSVDGSITASEITALKEEFNTTGDNFDVDAMFTFGKHACKSLSINSKNQKGMARNFEVRMYPTSMKSKADIAGLFGHIYMSSSGGEGVTDIRWFDKTYINSKRF